MLPGYPGTSPGEQVHEPVEPGGGGGGGGGVEMNTQHEITIVNDDAALEQDAASNTLHQALRHAGIEDSSTSASHDTYATASHDTYATASHDTYATASMDTSGDAATSAPTADDSLELAESDDSKQVSRRHSLALALQLTSNY